MKFSLGDRVRIIASGKTGTVCDAQITEGKALYIIDCFGECDSEEFMDCVVTVTEAEIESLTEE